jgi:phosphotransferase system HPr (HPr) family protein
VGGRKANLRSTLGIVSLCAILGTMVTIEADGDDEEAAIQALESVFYAEEDDLLPPEKTSTDQPE